ncbi:Cyclin-U4-1 [Galdieria sulphuraria]|nr:Cyclin-U4-1 [Galdieria sulphuraria]
MPAPYWTGGVWQAAPSMSGIYGTNQLMYEDHMTYASLPNCSCVSEDCCFEDGQPAGFCGRKHLFQSEEALVTCISNYINQRVTSNNQDAQLEKLSTIFHAIRPPSISVLDYLLRMFKYAFCSRSCFIIAIVYLERVAAKERAYQLTCLNVHRLLITSLMLAAKYLDDIYYNNAYYAKVGGVSLGEMNLLELELLEALNFSLAVDKKEYFLVENLLISEAWACNSASHVLVANNFVPSSPSSSFSNSGAFSSFRSTKNTRYDSTTNAKEYNLIYNGRKCWLSYA